jgi:phosphoglycerate kinase
MLTDLFNSRVLVRTCFDLPSLNDTSRIFDAKPTIQTLLAQNNQVIILTYWGRPGGQIKSNLSLKNQIPILEKILEQPIELINQYEGFDQAKTKLNQSNSQLFMLENTRFDQREQSQNSQDRWQIAAQYADLATSQNKSTQVYLVDESFPSSHRQEATNTELKQFLPTYLGVSYEQELIHLDKLKMAQKPFVAIMAGAKLETKLPLIKKILPKVDKLILAGALCFTFLAAQGVDVGGSKVEWEFLKVAEGLWQKYIHKLVLPVDFVWLGDGDSSNLKAVDVGPRSIQLMTKTLTGAKTIFWNGPLGLYEQGYTQTSLALAEAITNLPNCYKVIGGGDTTSVIPVEVLAKFDWVSMGGGATLAYLSK